MGEGPEPRPVSGRVRSGISFGLTLIVVIVVGALGGYVLGRYVFDRLMAGVGAPSRTARTVSGPVSPGPAAPPQPEPSPAAAMPEPPAPAASQAPAAPAPAAPAPTAPAPAAPTGAVFFVQVGAFGSSERADALARQLRQQGFPVVVETQAGNPVLYKVRVGPYPRREEALQALQRLKPSVPDAFIP